MTEPPGQVGERPADDLDAETVDRLAIWLGANAPQLGPLQSLSRFAQGRSNPTYKLACAFGACVLRRKPFGPLLPKAHMVEREYAVLRALQGAVPVPAVLAYCEDELVIGAPFFLMEFLDGRVFQDASLPGLRPDERTAIYDAMNATLAALHRLDPQEVGLEGYGRPENFLERQVRRWTSQYRAASARELPAMEALARWLSEHIPNAPLHARIVHGDIGLQNLMFHPREPRVIGLLDWELSTLGDANMDAAYNMTSWRLPSPWPFRGLRGLDLGLLGIPDEATYKATYFSRANRAPPTDWTFYLALNFFRIGAILQGIARRGKQGNAASDDASALGDWVEEVAEMGWAIAQEPE